MVMYPITSLGYLSYNAPIRDRTLFEQNEIIQVVVECFKQLPDITIMIKVFPQNKRLFNNYLSIDAFIRNHNLSNVRIEETPLRKCIPHADLFIVDYVSTMLLEILTTDQPIIFCNVYQPRFNNNDRWNVNKVSFWRNRILTLSSIAEIKSKLPGLIKQNIDTSCPGTEFLELYGIHKDDGKCLDRMVNIVTNELSRGASVTEAVP